MKQNLMKVVVKMTGTDDEDDQSEDSSEDDGEDNGDQKHVCSKAPVCKSKCEKKHLCIKASVSLCAKVPLCQRAYSKQQKEIVTVVGQSFIQIHMLEQLVRARHLDIRCFCGVWW